MSMTTGESFIWLHQRQREQKKGEPISWTGPNIDFAKLGSIPLPTAAVVAAAPPPPPPPPPSPPPPEHHHHHLSTSSISTLGTPRTRLAGPFGVVYAPGIQMTAFARTEECPTISAWLRNDNLKRVLFVAVPWKNDGYRTKWNEER
ncbi:hypothetical protein HZH68_012263 [Vespula germanica]|uniref:Uncharacterized protein n=1 Tax=Vespula germanica TaxID=30212 RepID=A0A834JMY2_VESGE|nr:hypothetical protein HZH68_012263 [Vespula germanica]